MSQAINIDLANIHPASIRIANQKEVLENKINNLETYIASGGKTTLLDEVLKDIELNIYSKLQ